MSCLPPSSFWMYWDSLPVPPVIVICIDLLLNRYGEGSANELAQFLANPLERGVDPAILVLVGWHWHQFERQAEILGIRCLFPHDLENFSVIDATTAKRRGVHHRN